MLPKTVLALLVFQKDLIVVYFESCFCYLWKLVFINSPIMQHTVVSNSFEGEHCEQGVMSEEYTRVLV